MKTTGYTYDYPFKSLDAHFHSRWTTNEQGEPVLEPKPGVFFKGIGFGGTLAGVSWLAFAFFLPMFAPDQPSIVQTLIAVGGVLFCIGGFAAGYYFDRIVESNGPYLIFHPDGSLFFQRLKVTIIPNETTLVEVLPHDQQGQRHTVGFYDLIVLHEDKSYYVISGRDGGTYGAKHAIQRLKTEIEERLRVHESGESKTESRNENVSVKNESATASTQPTMGKHRAALKVRSGMQQSPGIPFGATVMVFGGFLVFCGLGLSSLTIGGLMQGRSPSFQPLMIGVGFLAAGILVFLGGLSLHRSQRRSRVELEARLKARYGLD